MPVSVTASDITAFQTLNELVGHVNEFPTMHYFGNPGHSHSMIAYKILTEYFWKFQRKIALWECC